MALSRRRAYVVRSVAAVDSWGSVDDEPRRSRSPDYIFVDDAAEIVVPCGLAFRSLGAEHRNAKRQPNRQAELRGLRSGRRGARRGERVSSNAAAGRGSGIVVPIGPVDQQREELDWSMFRRRRGRPDGRRLTPESIVKHSDGGQRATQSSSMSLLGETTILKSRTFQIGTEPHLGRH